MHKHRIVPGPQRSSSQPTGTLRESSKHSSAHPRESASAESCSSKTSSSSSSSSTRQQHASVRGVNENEPPQFPFEIDGVNDRQKRQRLLSSAFDFGQAEGYFNSGESCQRTARETIHSFYEVIGRDTGTKHLADTDAKVLLMRFPELSGSSTDDAEKALFHPLVAKMALSRSDTNRELAGCLSTIMVQLELSRVCTGFVFKRLNCITLY